MATIDDINNRLRAVLPPWFPDPVSSPTLQSILTGIASAFVTMSNQLDFAALQTRINTASGGWLDMIAWDFFAGNFYRRNGEGDILWQPRILAEILRPRQTRAAIIRMLQDLTGNAPAVFEPWNTGDMGSYGTGTMAYGFGMGYGSLQYPATVFITAFRTSAQGIPYISGYGMTGGGYGVGLYGYISTSLITGALTDAEIYARTQQTVAAGVTAWVALGNPVYRYQFLFGQSKAGVSNNAMFNRAVLIGMRSSIRTSVKGTMVNSHTASPYARIYIQLSSGAGLKLGTLILARSGVRTQGNTRIGAAAFAKTGIRTQGRATITAI